jgi:hypothetical protein
LSKACSLMSLGCRHALGRGRGSGTASMVAGSPEAV